MLFYYDLILQGTKTIPIHFHQGREFYYDLILQGTKTSSLEIDLTQFRGLNFF